MSEAVPRDATGVAAAGDAQPSSRAPAAELRATAAELIADANLASRRFDAPPGAAIYEQKTPARSLYLLHVGQVRILHAGPGTGERAVRLLEILGPGEWFGAPALSGSPTYDTRALAVTPVTASEVPADRLFAALPQHPAIATTLIRSLGGKLQTAYAAAANLVFNDTNQRLIETLLEFSRTAAATPQTSEGGRPGVELRITHQQLAQAIGAARETVSLALTQLRQKNLLRTGRNRLSFSPDTLEDFYRGQGAARPAAEAEPAAEPHANG